MKILDAASTVAAGSVFNVASKYRSLPRAVQVDINGVSGAVQLQGRVATDAPWVDLGTAFTADGAQFLQLMPQVRANVTAVAGSVSMWVDAEQL